MECSKCKQIKPPSKEQKYPCFSCDLCRNLYCIECSELTPSEVKCVPLQKRVMKFHCYKCRNNELVDLLKNTIKDKEVIINEKTDIIRLLQEKLKFYEEKEQDSSIPSYANILKSNFVQKIELKQNFPCIIVKPKVSQNAIQTKNDINRKVNPADLKIGIQNIRSTKNGSIIIKCPSQQDNELLETTMKDKLKDSYDIELSKMRKPKIKIPNFTEEMTTENIEKKILEQNQLAEGVKVTYVQKKRSGSKTIFCDCSPSAFNKLINMKKIYIGWERYPVYENLDVPRCFQCQGFYHKKSDCKNKVVCGKCSEEHDTSECPKQVKRCMNCLTANEKYKTNHNTQHESTDLECPTLNYHIQVLKNKTDYHTAW